MIKRGYLAVIFLMFCSNILLAQPGPPAWASGADQHDLSFGFSFSYVSNSYKILKAPYWRNPVLDKTNNNQPATSDLNSIGSPNAAGFAVGFLSRYRLTEHLEVRVTPSIVFADRMLSYTFVDPSQNVNKSLQPTTLDFPLLLKLKSDRIGNFRAYLIGGAKYSYALGADKPDPQAALLDKTVKNISAYPSYEVGVGCDIYFEYFKLSPEIKFSDSMNNVLVREQQPFSEPITKLSLRTLMFSLYFE